MLGRCCEQIVVLGMEDGAGWTQRWGWCAQSPGRRRGTEQKSWEVLTDVTSHLSLFYPDKCFGSVVSCTVLCSLIHPETSLLLPQPWFCSSLTARTTSISSVPISHPTALSKVSPHPPQAPSTAVLGCSTQCLQKESSTRAAGCCQISVSPAPLSFQGKCPKHDFHMFRENLSVFPWHAYVPQPVWFGASMATSALTLSRHALETGATAYK